MGSVKREWANVTRASIYAAVIHNVLRMVEESVEDPDPERVRVGFSRPPESLGEGEVLEAELYGAEGVEGEIELEGGRVVRVYPGEAWSGVKLSKLLSTLPRKVWVLDGPSIRRLASETSRSGIEYMVVYFSNGISVWLEGDVHRVTLPPLREVVGAVHTHPEGSCALSRADVLSALDLMVEGGVFEAAATGSCMFYLVRLGLLTEDDYITLLNVKDGLWRPLKLDRVEAGVIL